MPSNHVRRTVRIGDIGKVVTGKTPKTSELDNFGFEVPFVTPTDFDGRKWIGRTIRSLSEKGAKAIQSSRLPEKAVLVTCIGSDMGKVALSKYSCATNQQINSLVVGTDDLPEYVYYNLFLRKAELRQMASGSAQPILNKSAFSDVELDLPTVSIQRYVVDVLSALDDRIDLLTEESFTLQKIAELIFKSWFIDFDPVRAKAEGREPEGMSADIAALFPGEFVDSESGPIPKGWSVSTLSEHVKAERGLSYKGAGLCDQGEGTPMHNLNSVYEGGGYKYEGIKHYRGDYKERHLIRSGDLIVTNTEQGHKHRLIGFPGMVPSRYPEGLYSHHLYKVVPLPNAVIGRQFVYHLLMSESVREQVIGCANGSTVNMLKIEGLQIPQFVRPPKEIAERFEELSCGLRARIEINSEQADTLANVRDVLLPRLLSGAMTVPA